MFEKFLSTNAGDFKQRYKGTYGFFHRDGKSTLVRLDTVDLERRRVVFIDRRGNDFTLNMNHDDNIGFSFLAPKCQWHNTEFGPLICQRIPQKQYRRGICENNTTLIGANGERMGISFETLNAVFVEPWDLEKAMTKDQFAVSPQFMVDLSRKRIKCNQFVIGAIGKNSKNVFQVTLDDKDLFRQEVGDAFRRAKLEVAFK